MHIISMLIGNATWLLNFKDPSDADKAYKKLAKFMVDPNPANSILELTDDFGITMTIAERPKAFQKSSAALNWDVQAMSGLFQARAQGKLNAMVQKDPQMMFLAGGTMGGDGPGIIHPK